MWAIWPHAVFAILPTTKRPKSQQPCARTSSMRWASSSQQHCSLTIRFLSPALPRGALQEFAEWRSTEFKALLRFWWRRREWGILETQPVDHDRLGVLRAREIGFLGGPSLSKSNDKPTASRVLLRLEEWSGTKTTLTSLDLVKSRSALAPAPTYLAFGWHRNPTSVATQEAFDSGSSGSLRITLLAPRAHDTAVMASELQALREALWLCSTFGAVGARASNGWGSLELQPLALTHEERRLPAPQASLLVRSDETASREAWRSGIAALEAGSRAPACWRSKPARLQDAFEQLAQLRKEWRRQCKRRDLSENVAGRGNFLRLRITRGSQGSEEGDKVRAMAYLLSGPDQPKRREAAVAALGAVEPFEPWNPFEDVR